MENAVATQEQLSMADIKKYIAPNATDKELFMFIGICKSYKLNPFKREIHFVKYQNQAASIIVGYESYIKRAERTGKLDGWKCWIEKDDIGEKAIIEIKRKDQSIPIRWEVYRKEFDKQQSTWKTMPTFMLKKVAIAQGFRLAFSEEVGGMPYIPEELPQTSNNISSETLPKDEIQQDDQIVDVPVDDKSIRFISEAQGKRMFAIARTNGWDNAELKQYLIDTYSVASSKEIPADVYDSIIKYIEENSKVAA